MSAILNPALFGRLRRNFGDVKVVCSGEAWRAVKLRRQRVGTRRFIIDQSGEYYRINCPYCNDTRYRLYINHMFGQDDGDGRPMNFLAVCYNEGCLSRIGNFQHFLETLNSCGHLRYARVRPGVVVPETERAVVMPEQCRPLVDLPKKHPAREYLIERDFDPDYLSRHFHISFCEFSHWTLAQNRIIIPIYQEGVLRGWQARYVGELPWKDPEKKKGLPPKYFSCPNSKFRSRCIYNFDNMKQWQTGVLVEGPTDVWRGGSMFGCIFGNSATEWQRRMLVSVFRQRSLVLCLDPEEYESAATRRTVDWFLQRLGPKHFCAVKLPDGTDPGGLDREFLREYIRDEAAAQKVRVSYRKVR